MQGYLGKNGEGGEGGGGGGGGVRTLCRGILGNSGGGIVMVRSSLR